ncbi:hypothetical protein NXH64_08750 [Butyrivibrio fibrisolvens]|uniref:hypothetical protein n=1 Tax=Pseudobutyrivibrio ruminis TaxID=46206 RepID=UPI0004233DF6|nr:hypothetical protein [Pseudobutyrivibrio ruminis]MDC7279588.1 hypothetical protein [Butyrivibrio fibrisolvens]
MVKGIDKFRNFFIEDVDKYVLIGGAACDINFTNNEASFRATRDLDLVLIVEALTPEFGVKFWEFIESGGYKNKATSSGKPQFFRFTDPTNEDYPKMIELFARTELELKSQSVLTPVHIDDTVSSLSGILLNEEYYQLLLDGRQVVNNLSVLRPEYLILFKAKAYLDLWSRRQAGEEVHSSEYKKHKKDILKILIELDTERLDNIPPGVLVDISTFIESLDNEPFDVNTLINYGVSTDDIAKRLRALFLE